MLRLGLLIFSLALTVIGLAMFLRGKCGYQPLLIWGAVLVIAVVCERWRYRSKGHNHEGNWQPTGETFVDPETGQTVDVHYDPVSGERRYLKK